MASDPPVEAPEGTEAEAEIPPSSVQKHLMVGLPRLSRISSADNFSMRVNSVAM